MNALTLRILSTFPAELQSQVSAHRFDDADELVQQVALSLLEASRDDTMRAIFHRARSVARRFTQDPAHYGNSMDTVSGGPADYDRGRRGSRKRLRAQVEADLRLTQRTAQRAIKRQIERAAQGDLFAGDGSGVTE